MKKKYCLIILIITIINFFTLLLFYGNKSQNSFFYSSQTSWMPYFEFELSGKNDSYIIDISNNPVTTRKWLIWCDVLSEDKNQQVNIYNRFINNSLFDTIEIVFNGHKVYNNLPYRLEFILNSEGKIRLTVYYNLEQ